MAIIDRQLPERTGRHVPQHGAGWIVLWVVLAIGIPALLSGLIRPTAINWFGAFLIVAALVFTGKRAALIGAVLGVAGAGFAAIADGGLRGRKNLIFAIALAVPLGLVLLQGFGRAITQVEGFAARTGRKFNNNTAADFSSGFLAENIEVTTAAFDASPIFGVGLGNVAGRYSERLEIHSTYLSIVGTSGLLGVLAYLFFALMVLVPGKERNPSSRYTHFLRWHLPFLLGLFATWGYTYHLRKREFWVLLLILAMARHQSRVGSQGSSPVVHPPQTVASVN